MIIHEFTSGHGWLITIWTTSKSIYWFSATSEMLHCQPILCSHIQLTTQSLEASKIAWGLIHFQDFRVIHSNNFIVHMRVGDFIYQHETMNKWLRATYHSSIYRKVFSYSSSYLLWTDSLIESRKWKWFKTPNLSASWWIWFRVTADFGETESGRLGRHSGRCTVLSPVVERKRHSTARQNINLVRKYQYSKTKTSNNTQV